MDPPRHESILPIDPPFEFSSGLARLTRSRDCKANVDKTKQDGDKFYRKESSGVVNCLKVKVWMRYTDCRDFPLVFNFLYQLLASTV